MRAFIPAFISLLIIFSTLEARAAGPPPFQFRDGDRIVLVGDTLIERDQRYGYLETILTALNPDKDLTFRNLGWSGDTIAGLSRAGFDPPAAGYKQLVDQILAAKPTVLIVGYGMADSFDGESGRSKFIEGLNRLLDAVSITNTRVILLSPIAHAKLGAPWPDPAPHNATLESYTRSIEELARKRGARFIDLFRPLLAAYAVNKISDNGVHLNEKGYRFLGASIAQVLEPEAFEKPTQVEFTFDVAIGPVREAKVAQVEPLGAGLRFHLSRQELPLSESPSSELILAIKGLSPGKYTLKSAGQQMAKGSASDWAKGISLHVSADIMQAEQLRLAINRKNNLFFDRWRPQNITYLFGFRKHEQGNNAIEIPQFDPLVAEAEQKIARLRKPAGQIYELIRIESEVAR